MTTTNTTAWSTGKPTAAGDYIASYERNADMRRAWDGQRWSAPWDADAPAANIARARRRVGERQRGIEWLEVH